MKKSNVIVWSALFASLIFFFNPNVGLVDILPDFIGYILLFNSIKHLSLIDDRIEEAKKLFTRLIFISLARSVMLVVVFGIFPASEQSTSMLLFSFIFDIAELISIIPAVNKLFDGIIYLSDRNNGSAVYRSGFNSSSVREYGKNITDKTKKFTIVFAVIKAICGTLPEFSSLTGQAGWDESPIQQLYKYIGLFRFLGIIVSLIFGIIFLTIQIRYISAIKKDEVLFENLQIKYEAFTRDQPELIEKNRTSFAFAFLGAAMLLSVDFTVDGYNIIPDVLCGIMLLIGLYTIGRDKKIPIAVSSLYTIACAFVIYLEINFSNNYYYESTELDPETHEAYMLLCTACLICELLFIVINAIMTFSVYPSIIRKHTGFSVSGNYNYETDAKIYELHRELRRRFLPSFIVSAIASLTSVGGKFLLNKEFTIITNNAANKPIMLSFDYSAINFIQVILSVIAGVLLIRALNELKTQMDYKYMLS